MRRFNLNAPSSNLNLNRMATHFAQQRPSRGTAGFKFVTRKASKYDRPESKNPLMKPAPRGKSLVAQKIARRTSKDVEQPKITEEDIKRFYTQLAQGTPGVQQATGHKLPTRSQIDFTEDFMRVEAAHKSVKEVLERLAEQRMHSIFEVGSASKEVDLSEAEHRMGQALQDISQQSVPEYSPESVLKSSQLRDILRQRQEEQKGVRLSAEGIVDIITVPTDSEKPQQAASLRKTFSQLPTQGPCYAQKRAQIKRAKSAKQAKNQKQATLLTPILAEVSQAGASSNAKRLGQAAQPIDETNDEDEQQEDSVQSIKKILDETDIIQLKANSIMGDAPKSSKSKAPASREQEEPAMSIPITMPLHLHEFERANQTSALALTLKHVQSYQAFGVPKSIASKTSSKSLQSVRYRRTQKSNDADNLQLLSSKSSPRVCDNAPVPKGDNADLSPVDDEEEQKRSLQLNNSATSKLKPTLPEPRLATNSVVAQGRGTQTQDETGLGDSGVGLIELKLTHHGGAVQSTWTHNLQARLYSAGNRRSQRQQNTTQILAPSHRNQLMIESIRNTGIKSVQHHKSARHLRHSGYDVNISTSRQGVTVSGFPLSAGRPRARTITKQLNQGRNSTQRPDVKQVGTLLLSEKSHNTMEINESKKSNERLKGSTSEDRGRPLSGRARNKEATNLPHAASKSITEERAQNSSQAETSGEPEGEGSKFAAVSHPARQMIAEHDSPSEESSQQNEESVNLRKREMQKMIVAEIQKARSSIEGQLAVQGHTPQMAFIDQETFEKQGLWQNPERQLKFIEDTMKEHFRWVSDQSLGNGKPILSTRAFFSYQLQRKVLEQKILDTLVKSNQMDKHAEFKSAQQLAAAMMDMVTSSPSNEMLIEPQNMASLNQQLVSDQQKGTLLKDEGNGKQQESAAKDTINMSSSKEVFSGKASFKKERKVKVKIRNQDPKSKKSRTPSRTGRSGVTSHTGRASLDFAISSRKQFLQPSLLDLNQQENFQANIQTLNRRMMALRQNMLLKRNSRVDTINQLASPQNHFDLSVMGPTNRGDLDQIASSSDGSLSPERSAIMQRARSANAINFRKVTVQNQGGGFNRALNSGYFKSSVLPKISDIRILHEKALL